MEADIEREDAVLARRFPRCAQASEIAAAIGAEARTRCI